MYYSIRYIGLSVYNHVWYNIKLNFQLVLICVRDTVFGTTGSKGGMGYHANLTCITITIEQILMRDNVVGEGGGVLADTRRGPGAGM